ncbi:PadR family transcriptional regulator [Achromobacter aloeverae]|uniref:PadR family transcriptional regulator n=1 Tax=Achromobacter aloeverae TaxID=1750518 RepID=A0A4Q1HPW4_9BURK|nr:PadR family transcriptional regulator [Achromobacter aloeverae]RXN92877.1 PadR family transcriptional regulator [Achromobacter aloeverae]
MGHHHTRHCSAQHSPRRDEHGRGGHGRHGDFGGRGELMRGRRFSSEDLQLMLLGLLAGGDSHGYELIKALETRSEGAYVPSPGVVYPALTYVHELGLVEADVVGNKKSYRLSEEGARYVRERQQRLDEMFVELALLARKMKALRGAMAEDGEHAGGLWVPEFIEARRNLKRALLQKNDAPQEEQRRVAAILARAAAEIEAVPPAAGTRGGPAV